jgi:hypothetical protein
MTSGPILTRLPRPNALTALCAAALSACVLAACGSSSPVVPPHPPQRPGAPLQSIFEDEHLLHADPSAALTQFKALGADRIRVFIQWNDVAPDPTSKVAPRFNASDPAAYPPAGWVIYDEIVRDAAAIGMPLDVTVGAPPPLWAAGPGAPHGAQRAAVWRPSAHDFGEFMTALGTRYSGHYTPPGASSPLPRVNFWAIWNEPNYGTYLAPQAIDDSRVEVAPRLYRHLVDDAWRALVATGHGPSTDTVLIGETAPRGLSGPAPGGKTYPGNFSGMMPLRFIRALYCVDASFAPLRGEQARLRGCPATAAASALFVARNPALFQAGGFADHPYPDAEAPTVPTTSEPDYADFAALGNLGRTLDRAAAAYGQHVQLPIYSTEFGYYTNPPFAGGLPIALAGKYLNESEYLSWINPRIRSYDQFLLVDPPVDESSFTTGLEFVNGQPKPSLAAYRMPIWLPVTSAPKGSDLQVWGAARPIGVAVPLKGSRQRIQIQLQQPGQGFRTVLTRAVGGVHGYFDVDVRFPGSGSVRLAWRSGKTFYYSRVVGIELR